MAVYLPVQAERALQGRPEVVRIEDDLIVHAVGKPPKEPPSQPAQQIGQNMVQIKADQAWQITTGAAIKVAIVDTGIDLDHPPW